MNFAVYAGVSLLLFIINMLTNPGTIWFVWPLVGRGISVLGHTAFLSISLPRPPARTATLGRLVQLRRRADARVYCGFAESPRIVNQRPATSLRLPRTS
jgi:hypothetical protein